MAVLYYYRRSKTEKSSNRFMGTPHLQESIKPKDYTLLFSKYFALKYLWALEG